MNNVAILPKLCMRFLQTQNVKRQFAQVHVEDIGGSTQSDIDSENTVKKEN